MGELGDATRVGHRADGVRGERERDDARALGDQAPRARRGRASRSGSTTPTWCTTSPWSCGDEQPGRHVRRRGRATSSMISSPGSSVRVTACASRKLSVVMFAPKAISSGCAADEVGDRRRALPRSRRPRPARTERAAEVRVVDARGSRASRRSPRAAPASRRGRRGRRRAAVHAGGERGEARADRGEIELGGRRRHGPMRRPAVYALAP